MPIDATIPTIQRARDLGLPYFQLIITNWGNAGVVGVPTEERAFNSQLPVRWMAMDPGSDVDAVLVRYPNASPVNVVTPIFIRDGMELSDQFLVSVEHPFLDKINASFTVRMELSSIFSDTYLTTAGVADPFGTALSQTSRSSTPSVAAGIWMMPELRLLMGFEEPPSHSSKRFTKLYRMIRGGGAVESLLSVIPVFGRKRARVTFTVFAGSDWDLRVTAVGGTVFTDGFGVQTSFLQEFTLGAGPTNVVGPAQLTFQLADFNANYLLIKGTANAGTPIRVQVAVAD